MEYIKKSQWLKAKKSQSCSRRSLLSLGQFEGVRQGRSREEKKLGEATKKAMGAHLGYMKEIQKTNVAEMLPKSQQSD